MDQREGRSIQPLQILNELVNLENKGGQNDPSKRRELKAKLSTLHIPIVCLVEIRVKEENVSRVKDIITPGWSFYAQYALGRIWICWKHNKCSVQDLLKSQDLSLFVYDSSEGHRKKEEVGEFKAQIVNGASFQQVIFMW